MIKLSEIRAACEAATPGPWFVGRNCVVRSSDFDMGVMYCERVAAFVALARTALPALLEAVDEMLRRERYVESIMAETLRSAGIEVDE